MVFQCDRVPGANLILCDPAEQKKTLSGIRFQVGLLDRFDSHRRLAPEFRALQPDVTSHTRGCNEQRAERDEKDNY
jgi:hypothetical protein